MLFRIVGPNDTKRFPLKAELSFRIDSSITVPTGFQVLYKLTLKGPGIAVEGVSWGQVEKAVKLFGPSGSWVIGEYREGQLSSEPIEGSYTLSANAYKIPAGTLPGKFRTTMYPISPKAESTFEFSLYNIEVCDDTGGETITNLAPTPGGAVPVQLQRISAKRTEDMILWAVIKRNASAFSDLKKYLDKALEPFQGNSPFQGVDVYEKLRLAVSAWMMVNMTTLWDVGTILDRIDEFYGMSDANSNAYITKVIDEHFENRADLNEGKLTSYLNHILGNRPEHIQSPGELDITKDPYIVERLTEPALCELLWSYYHEEGMIVQSMQVLSLRFQNKKLRPGRDSLAAFNTSPLRPLSNWLWGYIQSEPERLSVRRRNYEYDHHYGISLIGKAVSDFQPADSRRAFIGAFHRLLNLCLLFYRQKDDTTVAADAFPVKNALQDVHIILAEGAHNQFGDLPWQARLEMHIEQYILSRPEMREFLGGRSMVPYREPWMENVDTMKRLQGWADVSVQHFNNLARTGEAILLGVRHGSWNLPEIKADHADNWAVAHRDLVQEYVHSYRAATGVDLADQKQVDDTMPSVHFHRKYEEKSGRVA